MVDIENIKDPASLEEWLVQTGQALESCFWLAHRAAMRALPDYWAWGGNQIISLMPVLRASLIVNAAAARKSELIFDQTYQRRTADIADMVAQSLMVQMTDKKDKNINNDSLSDLDKLTVILATSAALSVASSADVICVGELFPKATSLAVERAANSNSWSNIIKDCKILDTYNHLRHLWPLWHERPNSKANVWRKVKETFTEDHWRFWLDWYERALAGEEQNWDLIQEIALQPDEFWEGSDEEINRRIMGLAEEYAVAASKVGERIQVVQIAGEDRFETVPDTDLPPDVFADARERVRDAVEEIRATHNHSQTSRVLDEELSRIERYLERYPDRPMRLYEVCMRTLRRVASKKERGELLGDDLLDDFVIEIENSALDVLQNDSKVKEAIRLRAAVKFERMSAEEQQHYRGLMDFLAGKSIPPLAADMREDGAAVADPMTPEDDRSEAFVRSGGRVLRMKRVGWHLFNGAAGSASLISLIIQLLS